ncbi:MAG: ester cyclase [Bacteroidia bacterium]|nr:ester cyclase [Bacteroidia bacterium]
MQTIYEKINDLNDLVLQGRPLDAFEKYYHNDVVMQENEMTPTIGKDANRERELAFFASLVEFRKARVLKVSVGENVSMVEWHYDYTHKDWGVRNYTQVSVQEWADGKIIREKFYYGE